MIPHPLRNLQQSNRFRILDTAWVEPGGAYVVPDGANTGSVSVQNTPTVKLNWSGNVLVNCTAATASVAAAADNAFHVLAFAGSTSQTPTFYGKCRVRFVG